MARGWQQTWSDLLASLRGGSPNAEKGRPTEGPAPSPGNGGGEAALEADGSAATASVSETAPAGPRDRSVRQTGLSRRWFVPMAVIAVLMAVSWLLSLTDFGDDLLAPAPPAPDVVATFDGGRITLDEVESHLNLLVPSRLRQLDRSPEALLPMVEDLISDQLVLRWAAERRPEAEETFRHAMKHINEELSLDVFADRLHDDSITIAESDIRNYYDANKARYEGRTYAQERAGIRQILMAEREPQFIKKYIERLRINASVTRNFELLDIPPPSEEKIGRYYRANLGKFVVPRRAVVDEIEIPVSVFGDTARQRASDLLLRIRGGASFKEMADRLAGTRLSTNREVAEGTRPPAWDANVFALAPGELGSMFRAGGSFYIVRLARLEPARSQMLSEVRSVVASALRQRTEREWFEANGQKTLFTLNGQRYALGQFYEEYRELPASLQGRFAGPEGLRRLADSLIDRLLLVADAYGELLDARTKPLADESRLRLLRQMMEQEEIDDKIEVTQEEMLAFYAENGERMALPPKARIRYIRIGLGAGGDEERRARERAEEAYEKLVPGFFADGADFAAVAKEYSEDPETAINGGERPGWIGESGDLLVEIADHPFHQAVMRLDPGEISKPFQVSDSLYVVQVIERTEPEPLSFEKVRPFIEEVLTERKHGTLAAELQRRLLQEADVVLYPGVLEEYLKSRR